MDGRNIKEYDIKEYMTLFAPVFQDFKLFGFTISENIKFEEAHNSDLQEIIDLVGLEEFVDKLEKGLDTRLLMRKEWSLLVVSNKRLQ